MHLVVGLGNPGKKYTKNRHNLGYLIVDEFAREEGLFWRYNPDWTSYYVKSHKQPAVVSSGAKGVIDYVLLKPTTFMNKSGAAVKSASIFFKIPKSDILVIHDDLDLPFGKIRLAFDSMSAGHKGVDSVIESMAGVEFGRLRIGIGRPSRSTYAKASVDKKASDGKQKETENYVLSDFTREEQKELKNIIKISKEALKSYLSDGIFATMNRFN